MNTVAGPELLVSRDVVSADELVGPEELLEDNAEVEELDVVDMLVLDTNVEVDINVDVEEEMLVVVLVVLLLVVVVGIDVEETDVVCVEETDDDDVPTVPEASAICA